MKTIPIPDGFIVKNTTRMGNIIITEIEEEKNKREDQEYVMKLNVDINEFNNKLHVMINDSMILSIDSIGILTFYPPKKDCIKKLYDKWLTTGKKVDNHDSVRWHGYDWCITKQCCLKIDNKCNVFDLELSEPCSIPEIPFLKKYANNYVIIH